MAKSRLVLTTKRKRVKFFIKKPRGDRHWLTPSEEWRVCLLGDYGFSYKAIAIRVFGNGDPKFVPSDADRRRVGRILSANKIRVRDWRDCKTSSSRSFAAGLMRQKVSSAPKLKIAAG